MTEIPGRNPQIRHQGEHLGTICRVIVSSKLDVDRLTGSDVIEVLNRVTAESGLTTLTGDFVKNPLGYLTTLLRRANAYVHYAEYRTVTERHNAAAARRAQLIEEQARARAEREAEWARANTPESIAAREAFFAAYRGKQNA